MTELFDGVTIAATSDAFTVTSLTGVTCDGLADGEYIGILVEKFDGTYQPLTVGSKIAAQLSKDLNTVPIVSPGNYKLSKGITASAVSAGYTSA